MDRGRRIEIDADRPLGLLGDGERARTLPATVTVVPAALRVVMARRQVAE